MKKVIAVLLVFLMAFCSSLTTFAASVDSSNEASHLEESIATSEAEHDSRDENIVLDDNIKWAEIGSAIGPPPPVPEGLAEKEHLAEKYVAAKFAGNYEKAAELLIQQQEYDIALSNIGKANGVSKASLNGLVMEKSHAVMAAAAVQNSVTVTHYAQDTGYWCGFAMLQMLLKEVGITKTQTQIIQTIYNTTSPTKELPWYGNNGNSLSEYPSTTYLNGLFLGHVWFPYPTGAAGTKPPSSANVKTRVVSCIDSGFAPAALGLSTASDKLHPNYPSRNIGHWVAINRYLTSGNNIGIVDPANSPNVSWSTKPPKYYTVTLNKLTSFVKTKGIIW